MVRVCRVRPAKAGERPSGRSHSLIGEVPPCGIAVLSANTTASELSQSALRGRRSIGLHVSYLFPVSFRKDVWLPICSWSTVNPNSGNEFALRFATIVDAFVVLTAPWCPGLASGHHIAFYKGIAYRTESVMMDACTSFTYCNASTGRSIRVSPPI